MKATVTTTTLSILATMTLVVACGSKKDKPADPAAAPVAPAAIQTMGVGEYQGVSVLCSSQPSSEAMTAGQSDVYLNLTDKNTYTLGTSKTQGAKLETGSYQFKKADGQTGDVEKGDIAFTPSKKDEKSEAKVDQAKYTFQKDGTLTIEKSGEDSNCNKGDTVLMTFKKVSSAPTAPAPEDAAKNPDASKNAAPSVGDVPAAPATTGTDAPAPETLPATPTQEKARK